MNVTLVGITTATFVFLLLIVLLQNQIMPPPPPPVQATLAAVSASRGCLFPVIRSDAGAVAIRG